MGVMSSQRVGTCSLCGGSVMGIRGAWFSVSPPPPDRCSQCNAVALTDVIKMYPAPTPLKQGNPDWPWKPQ